MENVAKNEVVVNEVVVNAVKENVEKKEEKEMENTTTTLTFELVRNAHDAIDVKFSDKPCREILNRLNEGFTKRSERFNWFNGVWSTFRFNKSKELERSNKDLEMQECKMFIEKILSEPLTMTEEEAKEKAKEMRNANKPKKTEKKAEKKTTTKKSTKSTKKAKTSAKKEIKAEEKAEAEQLNKKLNEYLKKVNLKREDFDKMPTEVKASIIAGANL